ncbi:hypothetical protein A0O00_03555 [Proteus mirabilis]|nr:hypothetical protein A0O00_03555 [Proteus mirabilis]
MIRFIASPLLLPVILLLFILVKIKKTEINHLINYFFVDQNLPPIKKYFKCNLMVFRWLMI